jgi:hypothetical protein
MVTHCNGDAEEAATGELVHLVCLVYLVISFNQTNETN